RRGEAVHVVLEQGLEFRAPPRQPLFRGRHAAAAEQGQGVGQLGGGGQSGDFGEGGLGRGGLVDGGQEGQGGRRGEDQASHARPSTPGGPSGFPEYSRGAAPAERGRCRGGG